MSMEITSDNRYVVPPGNAVQVPAGNAVQMGPSSDFSAASDPRRAEGSGASAPMVSASTMVPGPGNAYDAGATRPREPSRVNEYA